MPFEIPPHPWTKQTRIFLPLILTIVLLVVPACTMAEEPSSNTYGSDLTTPARRPLDTWGRGPFCWSCHNLVYPSPPDWRPGEPEFFMKATPMEPGLKRLTDSRGRDIGVVYHPKEDRILCS